MNAVSINRQAVLAAFEECKIVSGVFEKLACLIHN